MLSDERDQLAYSARPPAKPILLQDIYDSWQQPPDPWYVVAGRVAGRLLLLAVLALGALIVLLSMLSGGTARGDRYSPF